MVVSARGLGLSVAIVAFAGCGGAPTSTAGPGVETAVEDHAAPTSDAPAHASTGETPAKAPSHPSSGPAAVAKTPDQPPPPPKRERIRLHNSCPKPLKFYIVRVNDAELQSSITNGSSIEERATDGDEVQIIGENNAVVAKIKIEASMNLVDFAQNCTALQGQ